MLTRLFSLFVLTTLIFPAPLILIPISPKNVLSPASRAMLDLGPESIRRHVDAYLNSRKDLTQETFDKAKANMAKNISLWLDENYMSNANLFVQKHLTLAREALIAELQKAVLGETAEIRNRSWQRLLDAFYDDVQFGTAGIRGDAFASDGKDEKGKPIYGPANDGDALFDNFEAPILKGTFTINHVIFLRYSQCVANYMKENGKDSIVIACDSRVQGMEFADLVAGVFLANGINVYLFDSPSPMPEMSFAVKWLEEKWCDEEEKRTGKRPALPNKTMGIDITASHNKWISQGYKIANTTGGQLLAAEKKAIVEKIEGKFEEVVQDGVKVNVKVQYEVKMNAVEWCSLLDAVTRSGYGKLVRLGGAKPLPKHDLTDLPRQRRGSFYGDSSRRPIPDIPHLDMHSEHAKQVRKHIFLSQTVREIYGQEVKVGFCAFDGAGKDATPNLLGKTGISNLTVLEKTQHLDGSFGRRTRPKNQVFAMPDPGSVDSWKVAFDMFREQVGEEGIDAQDLFIGKDPDADRMGLVIKVPEGKGNLGTKKNFKLLPANEVWALLLAFELDQLPKKNGLIDGADTKELSKSLLTVIRSHVTTHALDTIAAHYGVKTIETMVGFSLIGEKIMEGWDKGETNLMACEESNGYSLGSCKPEQGRSFGYKEFMGDDGKKVVVPGHTLEKDGSLAAVKMAQMAIYAASKHKTLYDLLKEMHFKFGYYGTDNQAIEFAGVDGLGQRTATMKWVEEEMTKKVSSIAGMPVKSVQVFKTGKYDKLTYKGFPDEGIRFYFDDAKTRYVHVRPSGTEPKIRVYAQWKAEPQEYKDDAKTAREYDKTIAEADAILAKIEAATKAILEEVPKFTNELPEYLRNTSTAVVGDGGVTIKDRQAVAAKLGEFQKQFAEDLKDPAKREDPKRPIGWFQADTQSLDKIKEVAQDLRKNFDHVFVIGIGGSSMGARALLQVFNVKVDVDPDDIGRKEHLGPDGKSSPNIRFLESPRAEDLENLDKVGLKRTAFIIISKSGGTQEPNHNTEVALRKLKEAYGYPRFPVNEKDIVNTHFVLVTGLKEKEGKPESKLLDRFPNPRGLLPVPDDMGGRYSVFSAVGLLPLAIAGIDIDKLMAGVHQGRLDCEKKFDDPENKGYQLGTTLYLLKKLRGRKILNVNHDKKLFWVGKWLQQLMEESLGKKKKTGERVGMNVMLTQSSEDYHSTQQNAQQGDPDQVRLELVEGITAEKIERERQAGLHDEKGMTPSQFINYSMRATALSLIKDGTPTISLKLTALDEETLGRLMFHLEVMTKVYGYLLKINPFDQPGVQGYKDEMETLRRAGIASGEICLLVAISL